MKNLNSSLWIFTTAIAAFFAYHTYTHTRIRYKDLESVMMQNLAQEKGSSSTRRNTKKQLANTVDLVKKDGFHPKDVAILNKAKLIKNYADSMLKQIDSLTFIENGDKNNSKVSLKAKNIILLNSINSAFPLFVSKQDTSLTELNYAMTLIQWDNATYLLPFINKQKLGIKSIVARIETKGVDRITSKIGSIGGCSWGTFYGIVVAKSQIVKIGEKYEADMIFIKSSSHIKPKMQISEGNVKVKRDVGEIEIKNVKAQNYNSEGKATKTLTGKITIKKADGNDTTFTLSTSYIVKKK